MLTITTYDWVPEFARGYVRDLRPRWACEEAGLPYRVETVPIDPRTEAHRDMQPFQQVPVLHEGDQVIFESGAILLHLAEKSPALMPDDPALRGEVTQWLFAAANSIETATLPWQTAKVFDHDEAAAERAAKRMNQRLAQLDTQLSGRDWLVGGGFTVADLLMADVLRIVGDMGGLAGYPALTAYVARATGRPAFAKAHADQIAHFAAADAARKVDA
ncbi:glutathione S-transferase family protein [Paracoccus suum]|uniref:Glutathione S-transferase family protein n=1 Tax=Paracoccus suum TaxID=2259340 RepID=A0A344PH87_9RHOB|nr:glutathione S-transferase family protein [Paracoccus suum]AXC48742.1 glutathione S-transferase family protein [Paracoccus suum]